jgi:hypothetical protein
MADNNTVTKEDLQNAINNAIAELTSVIKVVVDERVSSTETKLTAEMDRRFAEAQNATNVSGAPIGSGSFFAKR